MMKRNGAIGAEDWKLYMCDQATGREGLHSWGNQTSAMDALQEHADNGLDGWLVSPAGDKVLPTIRSNPSVF